MSFLKKFSKDTIAYGLGRGIKKFLGFFLLPIYTRVLTPADYGILDTLATSAFFIAVILNMGLDTASGYYYFQTNEEKERGKILFTVFIIRLCTIIPAVVLSFFSSEISNLLFKTDEYSTVVLISCLLLPVNALTSEQELIYRFNRQPWKYNLITIVKSLFNIGAGIILVVNLKWGILGAQLASVLSGTVVIIFSFLFYTRNKYTYHFSFYWIKRMLKFGLPLILAGIAVWVYSVSDRYFLLYYKNLEDIGYYSIGATFSQPMDLINSAVQMSWGVLFYEIYNKEDSRKVESKNAVSTAVKYYTILGCIVSLTISVFAYEIVGVVTTPQYLPGITVIPLLLFGAILAQLIEIIGVGITLSEKTILFTYILMISALVNFGLNFLFVPLLGYYGAALTTLFSFMVNLILTYNIAQKYLRVKYDTLKLIFLYALFLITAILIPLLEFYEIFMFSIFLKVIILVIYLSIPILIGFIDLNQIKKLLKRDHE